MDISGEASMVRQMDIHIVAGGCFYLSEFIKSGTEVGQNLWLAR